MLHSISLLDMRMEGIPCYQPPERKASAIIYNSCIEYSCAIIQLLEVSHKPGGADAGSLSMYLKIQA